MDAVAALIEAIAALVTAATAVVVAWLAYKKYIKEEHISASEHRREVFSTKKQTTELRATDKGLELYLYDIRPDRGGLQWILPKEEVRRIIKENDVSVSDQSIYPNAGVFSIGPKKRWLYSKRLYPEPKKLHDDIVRLLEAANRL